MSTAATSISRALCANHPLREAAAKCVSCGRAYCRECVTPLDRRMLCVSCHQSQTQPKAKPKRDWFLLSTAVQLGFGLLVLWLTAYALGIGLLRIPSGFHEGTVWEKVGATD